MLDSEEVVTSFRPDWTREIGNQLALAFECASPAEVDETFEQVTAAGFQAEKEPWDAFWASATRSYAIPTACLSISSRRSRCSRRVADAAAAARDDCVSLRRMFATCRCTVCSLSTSDPAISRFESPAATSRSTSASRSERGESPFV